MLRYYNNFDYTILLWILLAIGIIVGINWGIRFFRPEGKDEADSAFRVIRRGRILDILRQASEYKGKFEIRISKGVLSNQLLSCLVLDVTPKHFAAEIPININVQKSLLGAEVECFLIHTEGTTQNFFSFKTSVQDIRMMENGIRVLRLDVPQMLEFFSRRKFLRTDLPANYLLELDLWSEATSLQQKGADEKNWPPPVASFPSRNKTEYPVRILDISSGGAKISNIPLTSPKIRSALAEGQKVVIKFILVGLSGNAPLECLTIGAIRNVDYYASGQMLAAGIEFFEYVVEDSEGNPHWSKIDSELGIPVLNDWVFKCHVTVHRLKSGINISGFDRPGSDLP